MSSNSLTNIEQGSLHDFIQGFREKALPRPVSQDFVCFSENLTFSCTCPLILPNHHSTSGGN